LETKTATEFRYLRWGFDIVIALVLGLVTKVILDWLMRAPAMGPSIDAEGEVSSRRGHLRPLLPILPTVRASQRCIRVLHFEPIGREAGAGIQVLGQAAVSTNAYIVQGGPKVPAARYIWSLYFRLERVNMIRSFLHQALVMKATHTALVAKLVVVIDDDPLVLEATGGLLSSWGCCVVTAKSCDEALVRLAETEAGRRPDLIVCDYQLSRGLTGVDAIERLRSAFRNAFEIPALLISADATSPQCEVGSRAYHLLYKPVNAEKFHAALVDASLRAATVGPGNPTDARA
jgi:CheY-like chemotaxis protein